MLVGFSPNLDPSSININSSPIVPFLTAVSNSKTYKITGINLQVSPMGEADRLLTILSPEQGLIKAIAAGSRKPKARLGGRTTLFVVNELLLASGRNFQRIIQAET